MKRMTSYVRMIAEELNINTETVTDFNRKIGNDSAP
jgi:hypothetical protein